ncbi:hypothetical protein [Laspinema olomoucense]|uniref:hypothetical protein n=1 Tax=Laspinema olomoucense TaxID=3231600 RepID=UPI0021BAC148|nr:hypothetical protein [Laspinema sp. D3c]MCT7994236.1 hypothetical protein [Laspinema sp. D3c]
MSQGVGLVRQKIALGEPLIVDLFGGTTSQILDAINVDCVAESGIKASVEDLGQIFPPGSVSEIVVSGPQSPFLEQAAMILKPGGRIYINATKGNPFGKVPDPTTRKNLGDTALVQLGLQVVQLKGQLEARFTHQTFRRTTGEVIPTRSVTTTILEKV